MVYIPSPKWWPWTAIWSGVGNKVMRKHQDINGFLPWGHGLPSRAKVMAPPLWQQPPSPHITFPVTAYIHTHTHARAHTHTCAATSQRTSHFPQYYSHTFNGQAYRRLFATEVLDERPLSTAFWITLSGKHPVTDPSASQPAGQDELLIWLGQSAQWLSETMTSTMQRCIRWTNQCSTSPLQINYTEYPESNFKKQWSTQLWLFPLAFIFHLEHLATL
jgi:hypothetical protein